MLYAYLMAGLDKYVASTDAEKELIELCSKGSKKKKEKSV